MNERKKKINFLIVNLISLGGKNLKMITLLRVEHEDKGG